MRTPIQSPYLRRFSLWLLGQALPETGALRKPARLALLSVLVASAAGTLIALSVVAGLVGLYYYLQGEGLSQGASLAMVAGGGLLIGIIGYLYAQTRIDAVPDTLDELQLFSGRSTDVFGELVKMAVGGFVEGMSERKETAKETADSVESDLHEALRAMLARLDALEEEARASEVVLDLKRAPRVRRKSE